MDTFDTDIEFWMGNDGQLCLMRGHLASSKGRWGWYVEPEDGDAWDVPGKEEVKLTSKSEAEALAALAAYAEANDAEPDPVEGGHYSWVADDPFGAEVSGKEYATESEAERAAQIESARIGLQHPGKALGGIVVLRYCTDREEWCGPKRYAQHMLDADVSYEAGGVTHYALFSRIADGWVYLWAPGGNKPDVWEYDSRVCDTLDAAVEAAREEALELTEDCAEARDDDGEWALDEITQAYGIRHRTVTHWATKEAAEAQRDRNRNEEGPRNWTRGTVRPRAKANLSEGKVYLKHPVGFRLPEVEAKMGALGAPTIRVFEVAPGEYLSLNVHRTMAAYRLGLAPIFEVVTKDWWHLSMSDAHPEMDFGSGSVDDFITSWVSNFAREEETVQRELTLDFVAHFIEWEGPWA